MPNQPAKETIWQGYKERVRPIIVDLLLWITVLAGMQVVFVFLKLLEAEGYGHDRIETLETIHFLGSAGILVMFVFDMFMKTSTSVMGRGKDAA